MSFTVLRKGLTAALTLAAMAAVVALAPVSSAKGGPEASVFAGTYAWNNFAAPVPVTISGGGLIKGSFNDGETRVSISGQVNADGSYSFTMRVTAPTYDDVPHRGPNSRTYRYDYSGTLAPNADGNLVGTDDTYVSQSFTWIRQ